MIPLFSVLIANYNNAQYIDEAIQSVFSQTYQNWEIIIIDDVSTDDSMEVISKYKNDSRIRIFSNDQNYGCGYTKRKCVELALGEIAGFLDPDDFLDRKALEIMVDNHSKNKSASMIYSNLFICDEQIKSCIKSNYVRAIPTESSYLEMKAGMISHFASFKIEFYKKTIGINEKLTRAVDQDLYLKLEEVGTLNFVDVPLYYYRIHEKGISTFANYNNAFTWNLLTRFDACERRGVNVEKIITPIIESEKSIRDIYENSIDFRVGKKILIPFRYIKKLIKI